MAYNLRIFWTINYIITSFIFSTLPKVFPKLFFILRFFAELGPECQQDPKENLS